MFPAGNKHYPVDRNNISPRIGFTHSLDDQGKSVVRGGYGLFFNRTILGAVDDTIEQGEVHIVATSSTSRTPPSMRGRAQAGSRPIRILVNGPVVNRAAAQPGFPARSGRERTRVW